MIRKIKSNDKNSILITTLFTVENIETFIKIQITTDGLTEKESDLIYQYASYLFNRPIKIKQPPKTESSKSWFSRLFGK